MRIIIRTKPNYVPKFSIDNSTITIRAVKKPKIKQKKVMTEYNPIPSSLIATPFYTSSMVFKENRNQTKATYDETLFFTGVRFFANKNYSYALQFFKEIVNKYPQSSFYVSSYFLLGDCYKNLNNYQKAIDVYKKAIQLSPKNDTVAQTLFSLADIYKSMNFYSKARRIYKSIIKDYAATKWGQMAQYLLAKSYYDEKRYDKAVNLLLNINKNSAYYSLSMLLAAEIFIKQHNNAKAVLAYYSISDRLHDIDIAKYYEELIDVACALCRFNDYNGANDIFKYLQAYNGIDITEDIYIGQMKCDLYKGNYDDLRSKAKFIISHSKNKENIKEAKKLLDEAKLKEGNVNESTINKILDKYADDPEIASLALYVYAKKNYRENNYKKCLNYLIKLKKLYPASVYIKKAENMEQSSINNLLADFYSYPDLEKLDFIYSATVQLNAYKANMCKLTLALAVVGKIDDMKAVLPYIVDKNCKGSLYAKYYIEKGDYKKALEYVGNIENVVPYTYYVKMVIGDVNYFRGDYKKAFEFYTQAVDFKNNLVKNYIYLRIANALYLNKRYKKSMGYLDKVTLKIYKTKAVYLKAMNLYSMKQYKSSIKLFKVVSNNLSYQERALFYISISYLKTGDKKDAETYFKKLKNTYPNSEYIKALKVLM